MTPPPVEEAGLENSYQTSPTGSGEPSPGLRPEADALGGEPQQTKAASRAARTLLTVLGSILAWGSRGLSGRLAVRPADPGHRPSASALGWALPGPLGRFC